MADAETTSMLNGPRSGAVKVTRWCGTQEGTCIWLNTTDYIGVIFSALVWLLLCFAFLTVLRMYDTDLFGDHGTKHRTITMPDFVALSILFTMSCWSYFATMLGDPGSVPWNAHPLTADRKAPGAKFSICGHCDSYKPPGAHHDRVSGRCISRMDHFCPWMNNAIGAGNQKNFLLFLVYTGVAALYLYILLVIKLFKRGEDALQEPLVTMTRVLVFILVFAILFTISMVFNQIYGIQTGYGTIDRMKMNSIDVVTNAKPVPRSHVLGIFGWRWVLPLAPIYESPENVFRYKLKNFRYGKAV